MKTDCRDCNGAGHHLSHGCSMAAEPCGCEGGKVYGCDHCKSAIEEGDYDRISIGDDVHYCCAYCHDQEEDTPFSELEEEEDEEPLLLNGDEVGEINDIITAREMVKAREGYDLLYDQFKYGGLFTTHLTYSREDGKWVILQHNKFLFIRWTRKLNLP